MAQIYRSLQGEALLPVAKIISKVSNIGVPANNVYGKVWETASSKCVIDGMKIKITPNYTCTLTAKIVVGGVIMYEGAITVSAAVTGAIYLFDYLAKTAEELAAVSLDSQTYRALYFDDVVELHLKQSYAGAGQTANITIFGSEHT